MKFRYSSKLRTYAPHLTIAVAVALPVGPESRAADIALSFELNPGVEAVALQFDVVSSDPAAVLATPAFEGASPHTVESNAIPPNRTRHVIYSTVGISIAPTGKVNVSFTTDKPLFDGMIEMTGVLASDAEGNALPGVSPNALPILHPHHPDHFSALSGEPILLAGKIIDPDGALVSVDHRVGGVSRGVSSQSPYSVEWTPAATGLFSHLAVATDNAGGSTTLDLGTIHTYSFGQLTSLSSFYDTHYGTAAPPGWLTPDADPFGIGIPNILAHLFGINPNIPDLSLLPNGTLEPDGTGGREFVFRFHRPSNLTGINWHVLETETLQDWTLVPEARSSQTNLGDGRVRVEARRAITPANPKTFMQLEATPVP